MQHALRWEISSGEFACRSVGPTPNRSRTLLDPFSSSLALHQIQTLSTALATNLSGLEHGEAHSSRVQDSTTAARAQGTDSGVTGVGIGGGETMTYLQVWISMDLYMDGYGWVWTRSTYMGDGENIPHDDAATSPSF